MKTEVDIIEIEAEDEVEAKRLVRLSLGHRTVSDKFEVSELKMSRIK